MDDLGVRTVIIGVNIFVTMTIVSLVIIMFFQMGEIYGIVASTDTSIYNKFDDVYSIYNGKVESGIGLLNTLKKFEENEDQYIVVEYTGCEEVRAYIGFSEENTLDGRVRESAYLKNLMSGKVTNPNITTKYKYEDRYNITVEQRENDILAIKYTKIKK